MLRQDRDNEYLLLHRAIDDVSMLPDEVRRASNVRLCRFPGETSPLAQAPRTLRRPRISNAGCCGAGRPVPRDRAVASGRDGVSTHRRVPGHHHHLHSIPSLFQEHLNGIMKDGWAVAIEQLRRSTRLIAISACTARDATLYY